MIPSLNSINPILEDLELDQEPDGLSDFEFNRIADLEFDENYNLRINNYELKESILKCVKTKPKAPSFMKRKNKETIREKKMREFLEQKQKKEDEMLNKKFKAKVIPPTSSNYNYNSIKYNQVRKKRKT